MTRSPDQPAGQPLSRSVRVDDLPDDGLETEVVATPQECDAIATELGLPSVARLLARFRLRRGERRQVEVAGDLSATITQVCVVTLEPFESEIVQPIEATFAPAPQTRLETVRADRRRGTSAPPPSPVPQAPADPDAPDPIVDGRIDLGAVAVEFLALGLDFYPRKPGVQFEDVVSGEEDGSKPSAFAALGRLKDRP